ncbi:hypothetical protein [Novosphingobium sp.]|uniref:hypothetical protein n=1 Tax=Novosphingobium sp. TaxID=1874826 RepID=UPI0038B70CBC
MGTELADWKAFFFWWLASLFAATTVVVAKLGFRLYGAAGDPPADPVLAAHWQRRRRYIAFGEISALPAFATISVVLVSYYHLNPVAAVLLAMAQGFVGFPLLLDGAAFLFRKRIGMAPAGPMETTDG